MALYKSIIIIIIRGFWYENALYNFAFDIWRSIQNYDSKFPTVAQYSIGPFRNLCVHAHNCLRLAKNARRIANKV